MYKVTVLTLLSLSLFLFGCAPSVHAPAMAPGETITTDAYTRADLRFPCGETECAGWLYLPVGVENPPVVVMGNGFTGTRDVAMPVFAETFASNGMAAFAIDYRYWGDSGGSPRQLIDPWEQLDDWRSAIAYVRTLDQVDTERLAIWGTSMGGGLVLIIGGEDPTIDAIVSQVPAVDADSEATGPQISVGWIARLLLTAWADMLRSIVADDAILIPGFAEPGGFGMIMDDVSWEELQPLRAQSPDRDGRIAARSITTFDEYNPRVAWEQIQVPTLLIATKEDRLAAYSAVEEFAAMNDHTVLESFEGGHFDVYLPPIVDWAAPREVEFLKEVFGQ